MPTNAQLVAKAAEYQSLYEHEHARCQQLMQDVTQLAASTRSALGTLKLYGRYGGEAETVMAALAQAQNNDTLKNMFGNLRSTLHRQREAVESRVAALDAVLDHIDGWKGKIER